MSHHLNWRFPKKIVHRSHEYRRAQFNHRENAFSDEWVEQNEINSAINTGRGTLQGLFTRTDPRFYRSFITDLIISNRDAMLAATVIQWLGTNCGMDFLMRALERCGYKVVRDERWQNDDTCPTCQGKDRMKVRDGKLVCGWCGWPWRGKVRSNTAGVPT